MEDKIKKKLVRKSIRSAEAHTPHGARQHKLYESIELTRVYLIIHSVVPHGNVGWDECLSLVSTTL
jgi:hypothetical protein